MLHIYDMGIFKLGQHIFLMLTIHLKFLQLDRKPSKCVVFEDDPRGITAAHNCTMMAIALIGTHPAYVTHKLLSLCHLLFGYVNDLHHVNNFVQPLLHMPNRKTQNLSFPNGVISEIGTSS